MAAAEPLAGLETDSKLAFDIRAFNTPNFNVERFLDRTRHSASLDEIHKDLRTCLQDIQSRMVTLINDDYTDFVKLSTSLHALHDAKQGLSGSQETAWSDYEKSTTEAGKLVSLVTQKLDEIQKSRLDQFQKALQLARVTAVKNLHNDLQEKPRFADLLWLGKVKEHVAVLRTTLFISTKIECSSVVSNYSRKLFEDLKKQLRPFLEFQNSSSLKAKALILDILIDIEAVGNAADFVTKTICPIPNFEGKADVRMKSWIDVINQKQVEIDSAIFESDLSENSKSKLQNFYRNCILSSLISVFAEKIRPTLLPINPKIFRECFYLMNFFIQKSPDKMKFPNYWKTWIDDFPISAYIRFHSLSPVEKFRDSLKIENLKIIETKNGPIFETSGAFLEVVKILLDDEVVLKNARHVFFSEAYKQLVDYLDWTEQLKDYLLSCPEVLPDGSQKWFALVVGGQNLLRSLDEFSKLGHEFFVKCAPESDIQNVNLIKENFNNCCNYCKDQIRRHCEMFEISLNNAIFDRLSKEVQAVSEVPKVYRWTKHPAPVSHSGYATKVEDYLKEVEEKSVVSGWNSGTIQEIQFAALERSLRIFHTKASEVLDSVEQIGSSLLRLKKKQTPTPSDGSTVETDEGKMKKQIALDVKFFLQITKENEIFKEVTEVLEKLLTRAEADL